MFERLWHEHSVPEMVDFGLVVGMDVVWSCERGDLRAFWVYQLNVYEADYEYLIGGEYRDSRLTRRKGLEAVATVVKPTVSRMLKASNGYGAGHEMVVWLNGPTASGMWSDVKDVFWSNRPWWEFEPRARTVLELRDEGAALGDLMDGGRLAVIRGKAERLRNSVENDEPEPTNWVGMLMSWGRSREHYGGPSPVPAGGRW